MTIRVCIIFFLTDIAHSDIRVVLNNLIYICQHRYAVHAMPEHSIDHVNNC
jgi:hypothetical protein